MNAPTFRLTYFHYKYWPTWAGISLLYLISWLPYPIIILLGKLIGRLLFRFVKSRRKVAQRNLEICFPEKSAEDRHKLLVKNFECTGTAILESAIAWWWPQWRIKRISHYKGLDNLTAALAQKKGVLLVSYHNLCLEVAGRIIGQKHPCVAFYRPHNNALMEYFQVKGRSRDNRYLIGAKNVRGLFDALANNEACFYLPDQDYGKRRAVFVPFFAEQQACTTTGTTLFAAESNCEVVLVETQKLDKFKGYQVTFHKALQDYPSGNNIADATRLNLDIETAIRNAPEQYMWVHRRFKTRPERSMPSLYL